MEAGSDLEKWQQQMKGLGFDPNEEPQSLGAVSFKTPKIEQQYAAINPSLSAAANQFSYPSTITSAGRDPEENALVGGMPHSKHLTNNALDFRKDQFDHERMQHFKNQGFQVLDEGDHLHVQTAGNETTPPKDYKPSPDDEKKWHEQMIGLGFEKPDPFDPIDPNEGVPKVNYRSLFKRAFEEAGPKAEEFLGLDKPQPTKTGEFARNIYKGLVGATVGFPSHVAASALGVPEEVEYAKEHPKDYFKQVGKETAEQVLTPFDPREYSPQKIYEDPVGRIMNLGMALGLGGGAYKSLKRIPKSPIEAPLIPEPIPESVPRSSAEIAETMKALEQPKVPVEPTVPAFETPKSPEPVYMGSGLGALQQYLEKPNRLPPESIDLLKKKAETSLKEVEGPEYPRIGEEQPLAETGGNDRLLRGPEIGKEINLQKEIPPQNALVEQLEQPRPPTPVDNKLASRVFERLKEDHPELTGELTYERMNMQRDAEMAVNLLKNDKNKAYRVAMGAESLPDQTSTAVNIAMAERALEEGNHNLYSQLVKKRSLDQTRRGQEIVAEKGSVSDNSTARYVKELLKSRMDRIGDKYLSGIEGKLKNEGKGQRVTRVIDREVNKISKHLKGKALDFAEAQRLIDSLVCK